MHTDTSLLYADTALVAVDAHMARSERLPCCSLDMNRAAKDAQGNSEA